MTTDLVVIGDAVAVGTLPENLEVVMGYDMPDTLPLLRARFPNATVLTITTQGAGSYRLCDMETGDLTPAEAAQWAYNEISSGRPKWDPPTIYCQAANGQAVEWALASLGLKLGVDVQWFMAWWNGKPDLAIPPPPWPVLPAPVGHQYLREGEFTYDLSVALSSWVWPTPPPLPQPKEVDMLLVRNPSAHEGGGTIKLPDGKVIEPGTICFCGDAGAVNLGNDWPTVQEAYPNSPVINSASLLERFASIALH
jgi:hypothetical protein